MIVDMYVIVYELLYPYVLCIHDFIFKYSVLHMLTDN